MNLSELKLEDLQFFVTVADSASITAAAEHLQTNTSTLSRRLKKLEEKLGARLLERTTRSQQITEAGRLFYRRCQQTLEQFEELSQQIGGELKTLSGRISVYAPAEFFHYWIKELVDEFLTKYPNLSVEFVSGGSKPHLTRDNIDVLIHIGEPSDSTFIAKKIFDITSGYYASPEYVVRRGEPRGPEEIERHDCIVENDHDRNARPWGYASGNTMMTVDVNARYSSDSSLLCRTLAEQGLGITMLPDFIARESVEQGRLVKLFGGCQGAVHNIYAMYASREYLPRKIRVFIDFLAGHIGDDR